MKIPRPLPKAAVIGIIVGAGLLVLAIGWFVVISPQNAKAASLAKQTAAVESQITSQLAQIAASKNVSTAPKIRVADVYKLAKAMPSSLDMPDLLLELGQVARDSGVTMTSISPSGPSTDLTSGQQTEQVTLSVAGDFYSLTDLLYRLRNFVSVRGGALDATGRLFTIDSVSFSPVGGRKITATVTMHTYVYGGPPVVAAPAPALTDTSTDTTGTDTTQSPNTPPASPSASGATG